MPKSKVAVRDKYYTLAKEQGYRARSSYKLLELNRKYGILDKSTRVIDLCAAPGGWLQVCVKAMPPRPDRQIIGVDLLPIKPLKGVVTFQADITTQHCRQLIRHELKGNQADVVLCDGAPNVGSDYSKDAFVQAELALSALRFATDHLVEGGVFITKVFRSADYNALMWVFQQLFKKVEATKPASSRNVSAEIFVVCREYIAPDKIDPRLLDAKSVFEQVDGKSRDGPLSLGKFFDDKNIQRRFREGYDEAKGQVLFTTKPASEFILSNDPVRVLTEVNVLTFDQDEHGQVLLGSKDTTAEIKQLCKDLKVLGKSDFRQMLRWRMRVRSLIAPPAESTQKQVSAVDGDASSSKPEEDDDQLMNRALSLAEANKKKEDKKLRRQQAKVQRYRDMGLINEFALDVSEREGPFSLKGLGLSGSSDPRLDEIRDGDGFMDGDEEDANGAKKRQPLTEFLADQNDYLQALEENLDVEYDRFVRAREVKEPMSIAERRRQQTANKSTKKKRSVLEQMTEDDFQRAIVEAQQDAYAKGVYHKMLKENPDGEEDSDEDDLPVTAKTVEAASTAAWFKQGVFTKADVDDEDDDDEPDEPEMGLPSESTDKAKRSERRRKLDERKARKVEKKQKLALATAKLFDPTATAPGMEIVSHEENEEALNKRGADSATQDLIRRGMGKSLKQPDTGKIEVVPRDQVMETPEYDSEEYDSDERATHLALGSLLAHKSTRAGVLESAYNRYAWNDGPLPSWFADDESKHNRPVIPVTKDMIESVKARFKDATDAPIKKVAEARARKRKRAAKLVEIAKKKAAVVADEPDMSSRSKMRQIEKLYRGAEIKRPNAVYVVAGKSGNKTAVGKTKGKRVKIVDKREKKDKRGMKRAAARVKGSAKKKMKR